MIKFKKVKKFIFPFLAALVLSLSFFSFPVFSKTNIVKAEEQPTYELGISSDQTPSGYGDPYILSPYWFYGSFSSADVKTSGVTFVRVYSDIDTFFSSLYTFLSDNFSYGGTSSITTVMFTNSNGDYLYLEFYYDYFTADTPGSYIKVVDSEDYIYQNSNLINDYYILPLNGLYVSEIEIREPYGNLETILLSSITDSSITTGLADLFGTYIPMYLSKDYVDSLDNPGDPGSPDFESGYRAGFQNGFSQGYSQASSNINSESIIQDYLNSEAFQQEIDYYKNQGILDYKNSEEYQQVLKNREDLGYNRGKAIGLNEGISSAQKGDWFALFSAVFDAPINVIMELVDFEILGYNLKQFVLSIFSVLLIVVLIRFFLSFSK